MGDQDSLSVLQDLLRFEPSGTLRIGSRCCRIREFQTTTDQMTILESILEIDNEYETDPACTIDLIGTTADGREVDCEIHNDGTGPLVYPGSSFLPYGGVYFNRLFLSVTEGILRR